MAEENNLSSMSSSAQEIFYREIHFFQQYKTVLNPEFPYLKYLEVLNTLYVYSDKRNFSFRESSKPILQRSIEIAFDYLELELMQQTNRNEIQNIIFNHLDKRKNTFIKNFQKTSFSKEK